MKRPRHQSNDRRPPRPVMGMTPLDKVSGQIVLLGLIASEAQARCVLERDRLDALLDERIEFEQVHFEHGQNEKWSERRRLWQPVECRVMFEKTSGLGYVAAPTVEVVVDKQFTKPGAVFSICERGLLRIVLHDWPDGVPRPTLLRDPSNIAEAIDWAQKLVTRALVPLFALSDPMKD